MHAHEQARCVRSKTYYSPGDESDDEEVDNMFLQQCAKRCQLDVLRTVRDIRRMDHQRRNIMYYAAKYGQLPVCAVAIERGVPCLAEALDGNTPVHVAAMYDRVSVLAFLHGTAAQSLDARNHHGETPLHVACMYGREEAALWLTERAPATASCSNASGCTPFVIALERAHATLARAMLPHVPPDAVYAKHPLVVALLQRDAALCSMLLHAGFSPFQRDGRGCVPMHTACEQLGDAIGDDSLVRLLLDHVPPGADVNVRDAFQHTALWYAIKHDAQSTIHALRSIGCAVHDATAFLVRACQEGSVHAARFALQQGAVLDHRGADDQTLLHVACTQDDPAVVALLLAHEAVRALVHAQDAEGHTALHVAVASGHEAVVEAVLAHTDHRDIQTKQRQWTPLHIATAAQHVRICSMLLQAGCDPRVRDAADHTPLWYAQHAEVCNLFDTERLRDVDALGDMVMHAFCRSASAQLVESCVGRDPSLLDLRSRRGATLLHAAAVHASPAVLQTILAHQDAQHLVHSVDQHGRTPLHIASERGIHATRFLLQHCADANAQDANGYTSFHIACAEGNEHVARALLAHGANTTIVTHKKLTCLHLMASRNNILPNIMKHMVRLVHATDDYGRTPLHVAVRRASWDMARWLLDHGADINAQDDQGRTCAHIAGYAGRLKVKQMAIDHGADENLRDKSGTAAKDAFFKRDAMYE